MNTMHMALHSTHITACVSLSEQEVRALQVIVDMARDNTQPGTWPSTALPYAQAALDKLLAQFVPR